MKPYKFISWCLGDACQSA